MMITRIYINFSQSHILPGSLLFEFDHCFEFGAAITLFVCLFVFIENWGDYKVPFSRTAGGCLREEICSLRMWSKQRQVLK